MINKKQIKGNFPIGFYYDLHTDFSVNFQMNRFYNWVNEEEMIEEMRNTCINTHSYEAVIEKFLELYYKSLKEGKKLRAAYYLRGAEFFMTADHPDKQNSHKKFIELMRECFHITDEQFYKVPYEKGYLPTYRFDTEIPKGTIVVFGGFDSYAEELFKAAQIFKDSGYTVILFEGPGQGTALEEYKLSMTHEWEKSVKVILDYFQLEDVTLFGLSLGGYFAIRAAAFEKRVSRVIADDICADFYEVLLRQVPVIKKRIINTLITNHNNLNASIINITLKKMMKKDLMVEWGVNQGMHVTGSHTPYEFLSKIKAYNTKDISKKVEQDVLLMAGKEDHYIPFNQLYYQSQTFNNVRSLTTRVFTRKEHAQNHCHIGNLGLSFEVILNWMHQFEAE